MRDRLLLLVEAKTVLYDLRIYEITEVGIVFSFVDVIEDGNENK